MPLPTNMAATIYMYEDYLNFETAIALALIGISTCNLPRCFKMELLTLCKNFVRKVVNSNF